MFYSHEVLTSRKYGVATVWLVATLGQKSTTRKVSRRAILDVDVPKACGTVISPHAPMALRLQSSLLYGISRVYSQQCGYVLADAQHAQNAIRSLFKAVKAAELDLESSKARPDQIVLEDDPAFVPGINFGSLDVNLLDLDIGGPFPQRYTSDTASLHTPFSHDALAQMAGGLELPSSNSSGLGGGFMLPGEHSGSRGPQPSSLLGRDDDFLLPEIDIGIDADGNFVEFDNLPQARGSGSRDVIPSDSALGARVREEHEAGQRAGAVAQPFDDDLPMMDDGYALPAPEMHVSSDGYWAPQNQSADTLMETSSTVAAPQRRRARVPKAIPRDTDIELRNRDLLAMNTGYLENMAEDWKRVATAKTIAQAKKNAEYWTLGKGIAGVGNGLGYSGIKGPLAEMWAGDALYHWITGRERGSTRRGQKRESEDEVSGKERRVRPRLDEDEFATGAIPPEDDFLMGDNELDVGREAQDALEDISSAMPWNISASLRGSSVARGMAGGVGGPDSITGSLGRRGSRLISASPTIGRGRLGALDTMHDPTSDAAFPDNDLIGEDDFELYGPGAGVDTQTAAESQWQRAALDRESGNFLEFIAAAIAEKQDPVVDYVEFGELLSTESNSRTVAAQALLHVLTLGTKNLIRTVQAQPFAAIELSVL